jgi:hypothetical protein
MRFACSSALATPALGMGASRHCPAHSQYYQVFWATLVVGLVSASEQQTDWSSLEIFLVAEVEFLVEAADVHDPSESQVLALYLLLLLLSACCD